MKSRIPASGLRLAAGLAGLLLVAMPAAADPIRIASWNITNYDGGQNSDVQTAVYGSFSGRCLCPDILVCQEFVSASAVTSFVGILNSAPGSPGDWAAATFVDGADTDSAFFYRTSVVSLVTDLSPTGVTVVSFGSGSDSNQPRNIMRYDVRPLGYADPEATIAIYSSHMKAGSTGTDLSRRLIEAIKIRDDAEALPAGWNFLLGGDLNIQDSFESAYVELTGAQANNAGRFFDPINTPGSWNNNSGFRFVHTQDPASAMDDRFDFILVSGSLIDGIDFEYDGNAAVSYSASTWDDPNHSYRAWGNDGTSYNDLLTTIGNTMVGPTIAQALINLASGNGHLPVFAEFILPPSDLGACCTPCGCDDLLNQAQCEAEGGLFHGIGVACGEEDPPCTLPNNMRINEVRIRHDGVTQDQEFIEIVGEPNQPLCGLSLVNIEGELSSKGRVDFVASLDDCGSGVPCSTDSNGYFVAGGSGVGADLVLFLGTNILENGTQTILLVRDTQLSTSVPNNDVDANNDGVADVAPEVLGTLVDAVGIIDGDFFAAIEPDAVYFGAAAVGPAADASVAGGAARCPNASDTGSWLDWVQVTHQLSPPAGCSAATPGTANSSICGGDLDGDLDLDLLDFAGFQGCFAVSSAPCAPFDFDADCTIGTGDLQQFRMRLEASGP